MADASDVAGWITELARRLRLPTGRSDAGLDALTRAGIDPNMTIDEAMAQAGPAPATMTGIENQPARNPTEQFIEGTPSSALGIDFGAPTTRAAPLPEAAAALPQRTQTYYNPGRPSDEMVARPIGPQSIQEEYDQRINNAALATAYDTGVPFALGTAAGPVVGHAMQAAPAVGRGVAALAAPVTRAAASHPVAAGTLAATGMTLATPAETQQPDPAEAARAAVARLTRRQSDLETEQNRITQQGEEFRKRFGNVTASSPQAQVRAVQEFLASAEGGGLYGGRDPQGRAITPDGRWGDGTRDAIATFTRNLDDKRKRVEGQITEVSRDLKNAQTALDTTLGNRRFQEMEGNVGWFSRLIRDWGPILGYGVGAALGLGTRRVVTGHTRAVSEEAARRADDLVAPGIAGMGTVPERIGRVNQFWAEGHPRRIEPFNVVPGRLPHPYEPNPAAPAASRLYQPNVARDRLEDLGVVMLGAADFAIAYGLLQPNAKKEVEEARSALRANKNDEEALTRLQAALNWEAIYKAMGNMGPAAVVTFFGTSHFLPRTRTRPNVSAAEGERGTLLREIDQPPPPRPAQTAVTSLDRQAPRRPMAPDNPPAPASAVPPPSPQEILRRRYNEGPIPGGHHVDPAAPSTVGEAWASPQGQRMWIRDREGYFRDDRGELVRDRRGHLVTDPRTVRPDWRRLSSVDDIMWNGYPIG